MLLIDKYSYTNKLSNTNPMIKFIIVVIALAITTIVSNNYVNLGIFLIMVFTTTVVAGIPFNKYLKILFIPISFLLISTLTVLLSISGKDIFIWSLRIGSKYIGITSESLVQSISLTTRVFASMSATFFLGLTTPLNNLIRVFKRLGLPVIIIELLVLIYRSIFIFLQESKEIYMAQELRFGYSNLTNSFRSTSLLIKALFVRVLLKYEDMVMALECKLYDGEFKIGD